MGRAWTGRLRKLEVGHERRSREQFDRTTTSVVRPNLSRDHGGQQSMVAAFRVLPPSLQDQEGAVTRMSTRFDPLLLSRGKTASVRTLYKRKAQKVLPQNVVRTDNARPGGDVF